MSSRFCLNSSSTMGLILSLLITGCSLPGPRAQSPNIEVAQSPNTEVAQSSNTEVAQSRNSSAIVNQSPSGNSVPYPAAFVQNFMNSCTRNGSSQATCSCTIDKIQSRYSLEEMSQIEVKIQATRVVPEEILNFIGTCRLSG